METKPKRKKTGGRVKGTGNILTSTAKQSFMDAYRELGGTPAFVKWAKTDPGEFYKLYSKLIPTELSTNQPPGGIMIVAWQKPE